MATPLQNLQAAYQTVTDKIAQVLADPKPNYTVDGVSVDRQAYYQSLLAREKELRTIPGVAPETNPTFDVVL